MTGPDNSVFIRDNSWRVHRFDADYRFVSQTSATLADLHQHTTVILDDGRVLASQWPNRYADSYFRIAGFGPGKPLEFGAVVGDASATPDMLTRAIAYAGGKEFWAASGPSDPRGFVLERWSTDGALKQTITRAPAWFRVDARQRSSDRPESALIKSVHLDSSGLLIATTVVANASWRKARSIKDEDDNEQNWYDVYFDVFDTRTGRQLASERMVGKDVLLRAALLFPGVNLGYRTGETADGEPYIDLVSYRLEAR
jgi:hypothetical protein